MMAGSHIAMGAAAWLAIAPHLELPATSPTCLGLAVLGSLLPDIDHPKSWVGKRVRPVSNLVGAIFGHRGLTHSLLAVAACGWFATQGQFPAHVALPLAVGYISHLGADLLTPRGLRLLWPLKGTWALPLCKAGSPFEPLVVALVLSFAWTTTETKPDLGKAWRDAVSAGVGLFSQAGLPTPPPPPPAPLRRLASR